MTQAGLKKRGQLKIEKILVPIVFSPPCTWAAECGTQLARRFGSQLLFVHVGACSKETVHAFVASATRDTPYEILICQGDPADSIVRCSDSASASLIVMPTHAHGRFRRFLLGSVTAKVLHDVTCPVLTGVHREAMPLPASADFREIVCAVDADDGFAPIVRKALNLSSLMKARLHIVHAIPAADETSDNRGEIDVRKYLFGLANNKFDALKHEAQLNVDVHLAGGQVSTVVRETVLRLAADLVVIGRGHTQGSFGRLRTHSYSIIRNSPCPVLSI